jgi:hypothetical protein
MAAPSLSDGISRAVEEVGLPSVAVLGTILSIKLLYGRQAAGLAYVLLTAVVLCGIYTAANYWNTRYTVGFTLAGVGLWVGLPAVMPFLIPDQFATAGTGLVLAFLVLIGFRIVNKLD